jgi:hypothetical protein
LLADTLSLDEDRKCPQSKLTWRQPPRLSSQARSAKFARKPYIGEFR